MDGVLVDWEGEVYRLAKKHWDFQGGYKELTQKQKMDLTKRTPRFYATLPWLQDGQWLWNYLRYDHMMKGQKVEVLTAMSDKVVESLPQKYEWCEQNLYIDKDEVTVVTRKSHKKHWAVTNGQSNILIDDNAQNCLQWNEAGGYSILFTNFSDTRKILEEILFEDKQLKFPTY
jgi:hypothetical protein